MAIDNTAVVDAVAYEGDKLILQLYDHLEFTDEIEKDHMFLLQDKLNTYIWYVDSEQYKETYPNANLSVFEIQIKFKYNPSDFCISYIQYVNNKLQATEIKVVYEYTGES
ncbi:MAG: branched-chain amino acid ABC transporter substrate-binding protein [Lachnospiraceae bacterium]|nr:branched-chain amino acid ABC transporter substrate-binding protein [Lachnospiraceae bacterium]